MGKWNLKLISYANVCFKLGPKTSHAMLITAIIKTLFIQFPFLLTSEICFSKRLGSQGISLHVPSISQQTMAMTTEVF